MRPRRPEQSWLTDEHWVFIGHCWSTPPYKRPTVTAVSEKVQSFNRACSRAVPEKRPQFPRDADVSDSPNHLDIDTVVSAHSLRHSCIEAQPVQLNSRIPAVAKMTLSVLHTPTSSRFIAPPTPDLAHPIVHSMEDSVLDVAEGSVANTDRKAVIGLMTFSNTSLTLRKRPLNPNPPESDSIALSWVAVNPRKVEKPENNKMSVDQINCSGLRQATSPRSSM